MQPSRLELFDLLGRTIKELEKIEDDPRTMNFVARRLGNIVKHMKDLREDLQARGGQNGHSLTMAGEDRSIASPDMRR